MPDYQVLTNPDNPHHAISNPYIKSHYKKERPLRYRPRRPMGIEGRGEEEETVTPPLIRDLIIMREGIRSIKGYKQLSGESERETAESMLPELRPDIADIRDEGPKADKWQPVNNDIPGDPMDGPELPARYIRGRRRGQQFNPEELELLRRAMLIIQQQGN